MEEKFNNLINRMKNEKMTEEEKTSIRFRVETFVQNNPIKNKNQRSLQRSPYFTKYHFATAGKIFATGLLLMVIGVGGLSYSSASALPGDFLYPIKINFNEKIEEKFVFTPQKKIALRQKRIETRFTEVESLIKEDKITPANNSVIKEAEQKINEEKQKIETNLAEMQITSPEMATATKANIENSIKDHQDKIVSLIEEKTETTTVLNEKLDLSNKDTENTNLTKPTIIDDINKTEQQKDESIKEVQQPIKTETITAPAATATINLENIDTNKKDESLLIQDIKIIPDTFRRNPLSSQKINSTSTNPQ